MKELNTWQIKALNLFANTDRKCSANCACGWKVHLMEHWRKGTDVDSLPDDMGCYLRQVRNQFGPSWLADLPVTFAAEVRVVNDQQWYKNSLRFQCSAFAESYAKDLMDRWSAVTDWRIVETIDPVTNRGES